MNKLNRSLMTVAIGFSAFIFTISAHAQWTLTDSRTDRLGNLTSTSEKHRNGSFRTMNRQYYPGTHVIMTERVTSFDPTGNISTIVFERRDRLNRVMYQQNEFKNNKGVWQKFRQTITYRSDLDHTGLNNAHRWDPATRTWVSAR